jgi:hypothetical protein
MTFQSMQMTPVGAGTTTLESVLVNVSFSLNCSLSFRSREIELGSSRARETLPSTGRTCE